MKRKFINQEGDSNKFWNIETSGKKLIVNFGKINTKGREQIKEHETEEICQREAAKLIQKKLTTNYAELKAGETIPEKLEPEYKPMDEDVFWLLIAQFNWKKSGDDDAVMRPAFKRLLKMEESDIKEFAEILAKKLYDIDGKVYAENMGEEYREGNFSSDWFLYVRCCAVANGKEYYYNVLNNPKEMPKDLEFEAILYLAEEVYNKKRKTEDEYLKTKYSYESFSNEEAWKGFN